MTPNSETAPRVLRSETLIPGPAQGLAGLLDTEVPDSGELPPLWHWVYLLDRRPHRELGPDGHPRTGIPAPPADGQRRMIAGGRVTIHAPLLLGQRAQRATTVTGTRSTSGQSGPLTFVTVRHQYSQSGRLTIDEELDVVYRPAARGQAVARPARTEDGARDSLALDPHRTLAVDEALLFRFSALTYNAHRIHYDHHWAAYEGHSSLVIHGPLQALLMSELMRAEGVPWVGSTWAYRLVAPALGPQTLTATGAPEGLRQGAQVHDESGTVTARCWPL